jgi:hypothetical protein
MTTNTRRVRQRPQRKALPASALAYHELAVSRAPVNRQRKGGMFRGKLWVAEYSGAPDPDIEKLFHEGDEP